MQRIRQLPVGFIGNSRYSVYTLQHTFKCENIFSGAADSKRITSVWGGIRILTGIKSPAPERRKRQQLEIVYESYLHCICSFQTDWEFLSEFHPIGPFISIGQWPRGNHGAKKTSRYCDLFVVSNVARLVQFDVLPIFHRHCHQYTSMMQFCPSCTKIHESKNQFSRSASLGPRRCSERTDHHRAQISPPYLRCLNDPFGCWPTGADITVMKEDRQELITHGTPLLQWRAVS